MSDDNVINNKINLLDEFSFFDRKMNECLRAILEVQQEGEFLIAKLVYAANRKKEIMKKINDSK